MKTIIIDPASSPRLIFLCSFTATIELADLGQQVALQAAKKWVCHESCFVVNDLVSASISK